MKGFRMVKQRTATKKQVAYVEIEKLLGSPVDDNGDEIAQFQADPFIDDQFCMILPKQILKQVIKRPTKVGAPQEETRSSLVRKMDDNHNKRDCAMMENAHRPLSNTPQNSPSKIQQDNSIEAKIKKLDFLLKESYEAYSLEQWGLAAAKYKMAWEMMSDASFKLHVGHINEDIVCYMLSLSLLETDQLNNLLDAVELLLVLEKRSSHVFPAVYYALSKAHHKHYRFELALKTIDKCLASLGGNVILVEYKIPGSDVTLKESTKDGLSISLADMKDECSKWHPPDAVCCMTECLPSSRWYSPSRNIYFSDPSFNGMVALTCSNTRNPCTIKFHLACWKSKKDQLSGLKKLSDKEIIGYECFTPNCEHSQGTRSLIAKVEVYGDNGKLKTHIDAPANPVIWMKRRPPSKGAIPKQQIKPKRNLEKIRRPIATASAVPRSGCKETVGENRAEKEWRLRKLEVLRQNNFGVKPACVWRPDMEMYGNPQMIKIGDFLGGPIFENDCPELVEVKTFLFTYFYEFIKENGYVKRKNIIQKWEEDKFIFDNHTDVLSSGTDICEFLLQSYKLVSLGDYIGTAENLPELYATVRDEVCGCLRSLMGNPSNSRTALLQNDVSTTIIGDSDNNKNPSDSDNNKNPIDSDNKVQDPFLITASPDYPHPDIDSNDYQWSENHAPLNSVSQHIPPFPEPKDSNNLTQLLEEDFTFYGNRKASLDSNDSVELEESHGINHQLHFSEDNPNSTNYCQTNSHSGSYAEEEGNVVQPLIDSKEGISLGIYHPLPEKDLNTGLLAEDEVSTNDSYICKTEPRDLELGNTMDHAFEKNHNTKEIEARVDFSPVDFSQEKDYVAGAEFRKNVFEEKQDYATETGTKLMETIQKTATPPASQFQHILAEANVQKIENDLAAMVQTVAQLKSVLEQNQARESNVQMLEMELKNHKMVSQESMAVLVKDLSGLEARYAKLESEKLEISNKFQKCKLDLCQSNEENVVLTLKNTELMHNYDKLNEDKKDIEHNFNLLLKEKSILENKIEILQRERDKMDKKLQKCHARLKEKNAADTESEQQILAAKKLNERKSKLESLNQEYTMNNYALEKALEKCYDHVIMLNDVSKLTGSLTGQHFIVTETHIAWQNTEQCLRRTIQQYKEDYSKIKTILESDREIDDLSEINLPTLNIVFPQTPNLIELYSKYIHHRMPVPPVLPVPPVPPVPPVSWPAMQGAQHQDSRYVSYDTNAFFLGQNLEYRVIDDRNTLGGAGFHINNYAQGNQNDVNGAGFQRKGNFAQQGATSITDSKPNARFQEFMKNAVQQDASLLDKDNDDEGLSQAVSYTTTAAGSTNEGTSQTSPNGQPTISKKVGKDLLMQELKKIFVGVPMYDLLASIQDVRKSHNDSLSGMRVQDIIKEAGPFINQRQAKHMAIYSPSKQSLPSDRSIPQQNKTRHRKLPSSMLLGQQQKTQGTVQAKKTSTLVNSSSKVVPARVSAAIKKPAWGPVTSGLVEWKKNQDDSECTICFESMNAYDKRAPIYVLPCQHSFHTSCIKKWLGENSICPICRIHCTMDDEFPPLPS